MENLITGKKTVLACKNFLSSNKTVVKKKNCLNNILNNLSTPVEEFEPSTMTWKYGEWPRGSYADLTFLTSYDDF